MSNNVSIAIPAAAALAAARIFAERGLSLEEAINLFLEQTIMARGMPFEPRQRNLNAMTKQALAECWQIIGENGPAFANASELFCELDKKC